MTKVFIDGEAGTTGLRIRDRLADRGDITLIRLEEDRRKDDGARAEAYGQADVAILCLPDDAAIQAAAMAGPTRLIDASTAHRVKEGWVYGMPELPGARNAIRDAVRVANVGCYATGSIAMLRPLTDAGIVPATAPVTLTGVSGYSGGGKSLIAEFEAGTAPACFLYALGQSHKHLAEIVEYGGLTRTPAFQPMVGNFRQGMAVQLHLHADMLGGGVPGAQRLEAALREFYAGDPFVRVAMAQDRVDPQRLNGTNRMELSVHGNGYDRITVVAVLDNLGKGASGTAIQNLNLMIGADETEGLIA
ncbi:N-acetyl-gamma-glutamyl-phosphate reductase [Jannaschia sp. LMIT008]|uniref:N-acetyl-gamma-glutamyl-phosphate reductase n=1 Tax=Jannaschia maritima TaxID=3032585 RepID=UPI0028128E9D|nr:N-acetyl-gamma-glutamyl-phosphate reductase [Jannaschia sp. LMIT008]